VAKYEASYVLAFYESRLQLCSYEQMVGVTAGAAFLCLSWEPQSHSALACGSRNLKSIFNKLLD
jgi:hypothetical protein